ncbi:MAG: hypothetical protein FJW90_05185 [Actinobacteria bacterium]|nr:hypothetical protein [Actinomycetota bacterium]
MSMRRNTTVDATTRCGGGMHVCPGCESELVQPVKWFEQDGSNWQVDLRCPDCEWRGSGSFTQTDVDRFDEELERGAGLLAEDLNALTRSNMEEQANRFAAALETDCILPEDF